MTAADRLAGWQSFAMSTRGWRRAGVAFAAGAVADLAMAPFFIVPVLFFSFPVLVWLIDDSAERPGGAMERAKAAASAGWWFGFGYFLFGLFWIGEAFLVEADKFGWLLPFAVTLMPAGLALFWAAAAAAASFFWRAGIARLLVLALAIGMAEWLRGHVLTGFPWNVVGYSLTWPLVMMQSAGLIGIYGLTLVAVPMFAAPLVLLAEAPPSGVKRRSLQAAAIVLVPYASLLAYGTARLATAPDGTVDGVKLRIVQPSVPQREKWLPDKQAAIFKDHLDLSAHDAAGHRDDLKGVTHLVWPEAAMPFLPLEHPEALAAIADLLPDGAFLLTGALRREGSNPTEAGNIRAFNSLMVFDGAGALDSVYDKTHLVPFGEYLPWQSALEAMGLEQLTRLRGGFTEGVTPRPTLDVAGLPPVGGLICYEAIFPGVGASSAAAPGVLVNVTNDGWFGNTTGPRQHFHQARVRAVEEGLPLIRAANNGVSAIIGSSGEVKGLLGMNERGVLDSALPVSRTPPLYARIGDLGFAVLGLLFLITVVGLGKVRAKRASNLR